MNSVILNKIIVEKNRLEYEYTASGLIKEYLNLDEKFFIEYSMDISDVPKSILVIPFLCNMLPISWVCDAEINVNEVDKAFFDSIKEFKQGYINMYPKVNFKGTLIANNIVDNSYIPSPKTASFFSGGVDAFSTLISHVKEKPTLVTLWGSDIKLTDIKGWNIVKKHAIETAKEFNTDNLFIKTSFRLFLKEGKLGNLVYKKASDYWWHGFQHGIGLIGHIAPYAYKNKLDKIYIGATFTEKEKGKVTCASDPTIDNFVRMASCKTIHDGYEFTRQDKIHNIVKFRENSKKNFELRECWESEGGKNCCSCEKCYRTIYGIISEKANPHEFGFDIDNLNKIENELKHKIVLSNILIPLWKDIQNRFIENKDFLYDQYKWIYNVNFENINNDFRKKYLNKLWRIIYKIKGKINL